MFTHQPNITVVLVHHNGQRHLEACLEALSIQTVPHCVVVIDNASTDGPLFDIAHTFAPARFIPLRRNVGFARAVNVAARTIVDPAGILVTLNPDTVPREDFIQHLVAPFADPTIVSVAGTLVFSSNPDIIASAGIRVFRNGVALDARLGDPLAPSAVPVEVFGASGGAAAYRLSAFQDAGGFCDAFFLYLEDVDLAWRLRLLGGSTVWSPSAVATHVYSASSGEGSAFKRRLLSRNRIWTLARCMPTVLWRRHRTEIARFDIRAMGWAALHGDTALIAGRAEALAKLPARLCERREIDRATIVSPGELDRWIEASPRDAELLRLRRLTAHLAGGRSTRT